MKKGSVYRVPRAWRAEAALYAAYRAHPGYDAPWPEVRAAERRIEAAHRRLTTVTTPPILRAIELSIAQRED